MMMGSLTPKCNDIDDIHGKRETLFAPVQLDHAACSTPFDLSKGNEKRSFAIGSLAPMMCLQLDEIDQIKYQH